MFNCVQTLCHFHIQDHAQNALKGVLLEEIVYAFFRHGKSL